MSEKCIKVECCSLFTFSVMRTDKNFRLSPTTMQLLMQGSCSLIASSIGTGATFSPPAVIRSSSKKIYGKVLNGEDADLYIYRREDL